MCFWPPCADNDDDALLFFLSDPCARPENWVWWLLFSIVLRTDCRLFLLFAFLYGWECDRRMADFYPAAGCIVFFVDASDVPSFRNAAEYVVLVEDVGDFFAAFGR